MRGIFKLHAGAELQPGKFVNVVMFAHSQKDPSSTALNIVELLKTLGSDPKNECIAVLKPWTSVLSALF